MRAEAPTYHVDPKDGDRAEGEYAALGCILEDQSEDQNDDLCNVDREEVDNEALDVDEQTATLANGNADGVKVAGKGGLIQQLCFNICVTYSSVRTRSEASLATSDPAMPMAMPTGASFNAGESFTPSPDIDRCFPRRFPA